MAERWTTTSSLTAAIVGGCGGTFGPGDADNRCQGSGAVPPNDQPPDGRSSSDAFQPVRRRVVYRTPVPEVGLVKSPGYSARSGPWIDQQVAGNASCVDFVCINFRIEHSAF
jgi:hypothetical protein